MTLPGAFRRVAHDEVGSTNAEALRLAEAGAPEFTLVTTRWQTAGRGRRGKTWVSPEGNLYASIVLRPDRPPAVLSQLSFVVALAAGDLLDRLGVQCRIAFKWPNDVLVEGAKISGILLEGGQGHLVAGIGVNLAHHPADTPYPTEVAVPTSRRRLLSWATRFSDGIGAGSTRASRPSARPGLPALPASAARSG